MHRWVLAWALLGALAGAGAPLTVRQVVDNSLRARGGAARFAAVHTLAFDGHLELAGGRQAPLTVALTTQPARIRVELTLPQGRMVQGYDGHIAWMIPPGQSTAVVLSGAQAAALEDQALNGVDLMAAPAARPVLLGAGHRAGHDYCKLRFTLPTGDAFTQYVDSHSWLAFYEEYPGGVEEISDYQATGGLLLPMRYVSGPAGRPGTPLVRAHIRINPPLPAALFQKP